MPQISGLGTYVFSSGTNHFQFIAHKVGLERLIQKNRGRGNSVQQLDLMRATSIVLTVLIWGVNPAEAAIKLELPKMAANDPKRTVGPTTKSWHGDNYYKHASVRNHRARWPRQA